MPVLAYHHVCDHFLPTVSRTTVRQFGRQLQILASEGLRIIDLPEYLFLDQEEKKHSISITFDDGLNCLYSNALQYLIEKKYPATVFVVSDFVGKKNNWDYYGSLNSCAHMDWSQLRELVGAGIQIGSHSHTHRGLTSCNSRQLRVELEHSKKLLEDKLGIPVRYLSAPFGRINRQVKKIAQLAGYESVFTLMPRTDESDRFSMPRWGVYLFDSPRIFRRKIRHIQNGKGNTILELINAFSMGTEILQNALRPQI